MASWPSGWRSALLRGTGIPITPFTLNVLAAWQQSTPTEPWTNNPLGMPAKGNNVPTALNTPYGVFPTTQAFRDAFVRFLASSDGTGVAHAMSMEQSYSDVWREIHALKWPAATTESEWPSALLDIVTKAYTDKANIKAGVITKTTGQTHAAPELHAAVKQQGRLLHEAATTVQGTTQAIQHIVRGMH